MRTNASLRLWITLLQGESYPQFQCVVTENRAFFLLFVWITLWIMGKNSRAALSRIIDPFDTYIHAFDGKISGI